MGPIHSFRTLLYLRWKVWMYSMDCVVYFYCEIRCTLHLCWDYFPAGLTLFHESFSRQSIPNSASQCCRIPGPSGTPRGSFYLMFYIRGFVYSSTASDLKEHALKGEHYKSGLNSLKANWAANLSKELVNWGRCSTVVPVGLLKAITCSTVLLLRWFPAHVIEPSTLSFVCDETVCSDTDEATPPCGKQSCVKY